VSDRNGNLYVTDTFNNLIRKITPAGVVTTYAGSGQPGNSNGLPGQPLTAQFNQPIGIAIDGVGNLYIADTNNHLIRKVSTLGVVSTLAGNGKAAYVDSSPSSTDGREVSFDTPTGVAVDSSGNVYVTDLMNCVIRKILPSGSTSTLAGSGHIGGTAGIGVAAEFSYPLGLALDNFGNLLVVAENQPTRIVSIATGKVTTVAKGYNPGRGANFITVSPAGNVYITGSCVIWRLSPDGKGGLTASSPELDIGGESITGGFDGCGYQDATPAVNGSGSPGGMVIDPQGNLVFADIGHNLIRRISLVDKAPTLNQFQQSVQ
jgi:sugar lactone lactonase YvrE